LYIKNCLSVFFEKLKKYLHNVLMIRFKVCGSVLAFVFLSACATQSVLPISRFDIPETRGRDENSFGRAEILGVQAKNDIELVSNFTDKPPDVESTAKNTMGFGPFIGGNVAVGDKFDFGLRLQMNGPLLLRGKYLLYGKPETLARRNNISVSFIGSFGLILSSSRSQVSGGENVPYDEMKLTHFVVDFGLAAGWRYADSAVLYLSSYYLIGATSVKINQSDGNNVSGFSDSLSACQLGVSLGGKFEFTDLFLMLEPTWFSLKYAGLEEAKTGFAGGLLLGFKF